MVAQLNAFDEIANLMATGMNPERLLAYKIPTSMLERYETLVEREKAGIATDEEKSELHGLLMINHVISIAKLRAMDKLVAA